MRLRVLGSSAITAIALILFAAPVRAQTASATVCVDGTTSTATGKGTCSGHGGVKSTSSTTRTSTTTKKTTRVDDKDTTGAIALCKNGMYSHSLTHRGACAGHGGVSKFLKP